MFHFDNRRLHFGKKDLFFQKTGFVGLTSLCMHGIITNNPGNFIFFRVRGAFFISRHVWELGARSRVRKGKNAERKSGPLPGSLGCVVNNPATVMGFAESFGALIHSMTATRPVLYCTCMYAPEGRLPGGVFFFTMISFFSKRIG